MILIKVLFTSDNLVFLGGEKINFYLKKNNLVSQNEWSDVNYTYIDINNGQMFEFKNITTEIISAHCGRESRWVISDKKVVMTA